MLQLTVNSCLRLPTVTLCVGLIPLLLSNSLSAQPTSTCTPIERRIPPLGLAIPEAQLVQWQETLTELEQKLQSMDSPQEADIAILLKACRYAIDYRELYREKDFAKVDRLLQLAQERLHELQTGRPSWVGTRAGRQVRGFRSRIDGAPQPIGLVLPDNLSANSAPVPLYVWLHGRGDKVTDLHFLCDRLDKDGQVTPPNTIVVHPLGRQCIGYKSAGEIDVLEAIDFVCQHYPVDRQRIVLMGFSMGGAGVWHLAAHYGERFVAASPGAGFAETARYQRLQPDQYPPKYEQMLWSVYDVPGYTRNLFNLPVVAYSGENDKQIQAARVMEEAFSAEGRTLPHLIGPGMGHKYHPETLQEILDRMAEAAVHGQPEQPSQIFLQSPHPRYARRGWLTIDGMQRQYTDTRVDASRDADKKEARWNLRTENVRRLVVDSRGKGSPQGLIHLDDQPIALQANRRNLLSRGQGGTWQIVERFPELRKRPGLSGPIDDAFLDPFLVVLPSGASSHAAIDRWINCELSLFQLRWRSLFRGQLRIKQDREVTDDDIRKYHLILWGTPESNSVIARVLAHRGPGQLPLTWGLESLTLAGENFAADSHLPMLIFPNPLAPRSQQAQYIVFNSGPTFRPAHDRTNSLQNPHLPDWAVISNSEPPSAERPGRIARAGFFDGTWVVDQELRW